MKKKKKKGQRRRGSRVERQKWELVGTAFGIVVSLCFVITAHAGSFRSGGRKQKQKQKEECGGGVFRGQEDMETARNTGGSVDYRAVYSARSRRLALPNCPVEPSLSGRREGNGPTFTGEQPSDPLPLVSCLSFCDRTR